jgi:hypothetical protein
MSTKAGTRRRKTLRRRGLGGSEAQHRAAIPIYEIAIKDQLAIAARALKQGMCKIALDKMLNAARGIGAVNRERFHADLYAASDFGLTEVKHAYEKRCR